MGDNDLQYQVAECWKLFVRHALFPSGIGLAENRLPQSIGGGIGQGRVQMLLLHKAHFGEVTMTVWPKQLHKVCEKHGIHVLK